MKYFCTDTTTRTLRSLRCSPLHWRASLWLGLLQLQTTYTNKLNLLLYTWLYWLPRPAEPLLWVPTVNDCYQLAVFGSPSERIDHFMVGLWKASLVINGTDYGPVASRYWYMAFERSVTRLSLTRESYAVALLAGARLPKPPNYTNVYTGDNYALVDEGVDSLESHCVTGTALTSTIPAAPLQQSRSTWEGVIQRIQRDRGTAQYSYLPTGVASLLVGNSKVVIHA